MSCSSRCRSAGESTISIPMISARVALTSDASFASTSSRWWPPPLAKHRFLIYLYNIARIYPESRFNLATLTFMSMPALATRPLVREAVYLHQTAQLSDADIARATGVARSTARAWLADARSPTGQRGGRLSDLSAVAH